ncbi:MAG: integration host factor subunit beta [Deltaproteobacteria bacterium]|nr:integration host factor subunit beta [Deltaproteobacteria bacterium]
MKKSDLIAAIAAKARISHKAAEDVVNTIFDTLKKALARGERIELRGLGSFSVKKYDPYTGRNPKTGGKIEVKEKRLPVFKTGKELQKRVNSG